MWRTERTRSENPAQNEQGQLYHVRNISKGCRVPCFWLGLNKRHRHSFPWLLCKKGLHRRKGAESPSQLLSSSYFAFTCRQFLCFFFSSLFKVLQIWFEKFILLKAFQQEGELLARHSVEDATFCWNAKTEPSCWVLFLNSQVTAAPKEELRMHWAQRFPCLCSSAQGSLAWLGGW